MRLLNTPLNNTHEHNTQVDMLLKLEDGKYLCVKDPMKELMRVYAIPADAFKDLEGSNYEDEQSGDGGEGSAK